MGKIRLNVPGYAIPIFLIIGACTVGEPDLVPKDVLTLPEIRYKDHRKAVVFVDMSGLPEAQREPALVWATEAGLRNRGFEITGHNEYMDFLKKRSVSPSRSGEIKLLTMVKEELGASAIVRVRVAGFSALAKTERRGKVVTPGVPGVRESTFTPLEEDLRDRRNWLIDLALTLDMMDTSTGTRIWSCSLSCAKSPYEGEIQAFIRKALEKCLETIPIR